MYGDGATVVGTAGPGATTDPTAGFAAGETSVDDVNDLEAPGRPPTPPWRARAPARNMSVAGVSGIN